MAVSSSFRMMRADDLESVLLIENLAQPSPWPASLFEDCIPDSNSESAPTHYIARVAETNDDILGYGIAMTVAGEAEILNLCVQPAAQGCGHGRMILNDLLAQLRDSADVVFLEVRASNETAQCLYQSSGFVEAGRRKGYYARAHEREDALVLRLKL